MHKERSASLPITLLLYYHCLELWITLQQTALLIRAPSDPLSLVFSLLPTLQKKRGSNRMRSGFSSAPLTDGTPATKSLLCVFLPGIVCLNRILGCLNLKFFYTRLTPGISVARTARIRLLAHQFGDRKFCTRFFVHPVVSAIPL